MKRTPLILIAGFLGAGKTTFLRGLMQALREQGVGFSVIVNDFENAEVDAVRLRSLQAEVQAINGSCVCCSSLQEFMEAVGRAEVPPGGVLLVEANGASDLLSLIAAMTVRHECRAYTSPLQVTLVDAQRWQNRGEQNDLEREQVQTSTHWQITHAEEVLPARLDEVEAAIRRLSPRSVATTAESFATYLRLLVAASKYAAPERVQQLAPHTWHPQPMPHHHHETSRAFTSMQVDLPFVVRRRDLESALQDLPDSVLRVKGLCRLEELPQIPMSFQHVRPRAETWFLPMLSVSAIVPVGVVIGVGMAEPMIRSRFGDLPSAELTPGFDPNDF